MPFALSPALLFRAQFFFRALEQLFRGEDFAQLVLGDSEFVKAKDRITRAAAEKDDRFAVRGAAEETGWPNE